MSVVHLEKFTYFEPNTALEASQVLADHGDEARIMAGGIDLLPRLRIGSTLANCLVNIATIPALDKIQYEAGNGFYFGAMAKLHNLDYCSELAERYPAVRAAIHQITSVQTKYMGTAVGNLCLATPASDVAPALMAYDAVLTIFGLNGERREKLCDFYKGYRKTTLARDEFVIGVFIPEPAEGTGDSFINRVRTHADIAKISITAVVCELDGVLKDVKIGIGSAAPTVVRARNAEAVLIGQTVTDELLAQAAEAATMDVSPITDFRSTEEYRLEMSRVLTERALHIAVEAARRGEK